MRWWQTPPAVTVAAWPARLSRCPAAVHSPWSPGSHNPATPALQWQDSGNTQRCAQAADRTELQPSLEGRTEGSPSVWWPAWHKLLVLAVHRWCVGPPSVAGVPTPTQPGSWWAVEGNREESPRWQGLCSLERHSPAAGDQARIPCWRSVQTHRDGNVHTLLALEGQPVSEKHPRPGE